MELRSFRIVSYVSFVMEHLFKPESFLCLDTLRILATVEVIGCGEGIGYLTSLGRPTGIAFQLGEGCYPCSR